MNDIVRLKAVKSYQIGVNKSLSAKGAAILHAKANPGDEDVSTIYGYREDRGKGLCTLARKQHVAF